MTLRLSSSLRAVRAFTIKHGKPVRDAEDDHAQPLLAYAMCDMVVCMPHRAAAAGVILRQGAALRRAAVAQWEVRLRVSDRGGAWRIVVSIPTGASSRHIASFTFIQVYMSQD